MSQGSARTSATTRAPQTNPPASRSSRTLLRRRARACTRDLKRLETRHSSTDRVLRACVRARRRSGGATSSLSTSPATKYLAQGVNYISLTPQPFLQAIPRLSLRAVQTWRQPAPASLPPAHAHGQAFNVAKYKRIIADKKGINLVIVGHVQVGKSTLMGYPFRVVFGWCAA
ncbi:hypothetical protein BC830DRAFT_1165696 [Chytriomyces sp. MP71]|nr:hypothetical protein BC830DRAFT_1165696 [Chytriomyces sp. MP71]